MYRQLHNDCYINCSVWYNNRRKEDCNILCQYFISLTGMGEIYNFVLSFVISVIITCGICFFISKIAIVGIFRGEKISFWSGIAMIRKMIILIYFMEMSLKIKNGAHAWNSIRYKSRKFPHHNYMYNSIIKFIS